MVLCAVMVTYFFVRLQQLRPFPVQVRFAYLGLLAAGTLPWMKWIHLLQLGGTTTMVTIGYCPLIRLLRLMPMNRTELLTRSLIWRVLVLEPCVGGLIDWSDKPTDQPNGCCSDHDRRARPRVVEPLSIPARTDLSPGKAGEPGAEYAAALTARPADARGWPIASSRPSSF
jgi:hypothetical protein